jgi:hypothetical protein
MRIATLALTALLLGACGSGTGLGDLGSIILGSPSTEQPSDVKGSVRSVDTNARRIDLDVSYINNLRNTGSQQQGSIYYDDNTRVVYQNQNYNVTDLERGDEIEVRGVNDNGRYLAQTITVVRDAS